MIPCLGTWLIVLSLLLLPDRQVAQTARPKRIALYPMAAKHTAPEPVVSKPSPVPMSTSSARAISLPLDGYRITSGFGWRKHPVTGLPNFHNGIDLAAQGKVVRSILGGTVTETGYHKYLGNFVRIDHGEVLSVYGHLSHITVDTGQVVTAGYPIGITGKTGRATGEHLHFSIRRNGTYINPWKFLHGLIQQIDNEH